MNNTIQEIEEEFALEMARSNLEIYCENITRNDGTWFDVTNLEDDRGAEPVRKALILLEHRGALDRHPTNANWVRPYVKEESNAAS